MTRAPQGVISIESLLQPETPDMAKDDQFPCGSVIPEDIQDRHEKDEEDKGHLRHSSIGCQAHALLNHVPGFLYMICVIISGNRNAGSGSAGEKMGVRYYAGGASEAAGDKDIMAPWCLQALRKNMMQIILL